MTIQYHCPGKFVDEPCDGLISFDDDSGKSSPCTKCGVPVYMGGTTMIPDGGYEAVPFLRAYAPPVEQ